jgi:hypothetical protein
MCFFTRRPRHKPAGEMLPSPQLKMAEMFKPHERLKWAALLAALGSNHTLEFGMPIEGTVAVDIIDQQYRIVDRQLFDATPEAQMILEYWYPGSCKVLGQSTKRKTQ